MGETPKPLPRALTMGETPKPLPQALVADRPADRGLSRLFAHFGRHQIASLISTAVDFGTMVLTVELLRGSPVVGTVAGASCGAFTNFQLGRHFTFGAKGDHVAPQAARYAIVSATSAALNALGEYLLHDRLGVQYFWARAIVAVVVSFLWNFPLQRHYVFRAGG
jgi:putative flippase GtrA